MPVQEPLYWVNGVPVYPNQNTYIVQTRDDTPDTIDALGDLLINSLVFDNPSLITIVSGGASPYVISTGGTSYIELTADSPVTPTYDIDNFIVTFNTAAPPAKLMLIVFSASSPNVAGGLKIESGSSLSGGIGSILLKENEDIVVDPTDGNAYTNASILFISDGTNWIELSRFLYSI